MYKNEVMNDYSARALADYQGFGENSFCNIHNIYTEIFNREWKCTKQITQPQVCNHIHFNTLHLFPPSSVQHSLSGGLWILPDWQGWRHRIMSLRG